MELFYDYQKVSAEIFMKSLEGGMKYFFGELC
jgi:hypothetical protein